LRWFWLFILGLVLVTGGLYLNRVRTRSVPSASRPAVQEPIPTRPRRAVRPAKEQSAQPELDPPQQLEGNPEPELVQDKQASTDEQSLEQIEEDAAPEAVSEEGHSDEQVDEAVDDEPTSIDPIAGLIEDEVEGDDEIDESFTESASESMPETSAQPNEDRKTDSDQTTIQPETAEPALEEQTGSIESPISESQEPPIPDVKLPPSYEQLQDGTIQVIASGAIITGTGTRTDPFVVDWATLRSVERGYKPKAGKKDLPDWLDVLDEKHVRITGNTLVPVIATTTKELLVMQNPWDGCCIGIPPSPYDAIEVTLNHDVDFGNSAVGYGTVEGVFILDPYVVDGWVLGLYIIDDATYRSGEGIAFPDF